MGSKPRSPVTVTMAISKPRSPTTVTMVTPNTIPEATRTATDTGTPTTRTDTTTGPTTGPTTTTKPCVPLLSDQHAAAAILPSLQTTTCISKLDWNHRWVK